MAFDEQDEKAVFDSTLSLKNNSNAKNILFQHEENKYSESNDQ